MATRIAVLDEGQIEQIGTSSEIYYNPNSRFVADFIGESNFMEVDLTRAGDGVVHLVDGRPVPANTNGRPSSHKATLMIRPESIHVSADSDAPPSSLKGRVIQTSFLGNQTRVAVGCDSVPFPITASLFGRERFAAHTLTPDLEVSLWWDPDDAVLLTEAQPEEKE